MADVSQRIGDMLKPELHRLKPPQANEPVASIGGIA
jgi:hypothetical protein